MSLVRRSRAPAHPDLTGRWNDPAIALSGERAALLVHGFTATPMSMASLVGPLHDAGIATCSVRLPGHGTHPDALDLVTWPEWLAAVCTAYTAMRETYARCAVVGLSLGSVLSRLLLDHEPAPEALVLLAMPWRIDDPAGRLLLPRLRGRDVARHWVRVKDGGPDISDPAARESSVSYGWTSLYAVAEVDAAVRAQRVSARALSVPTLMLHGRHDHVASVDGARRAAHRFGGEAQLEILPRSWHVLTRDVEADRVADRVAQFLDQII